MGNRNTDIIIYKDLFAKTVGFPDDEEPREVGMTESSVNKGFFENGRGENLRFYAQFTPDF